MRLLMYLLQIGILWIPLWIKGIGQSSLPVMLRKIIIIVMIFISMITTIVGISKPFTNVIVNIIGNIIFIVWLLLVILSAYHFWPRTNGSKG